MEAVEGQGYEVAEDTRGVDIAGTPRAKGYCDFRSAVLEQGMFCVTSALRTLFSCWNEQLDRTCGAEHRQLGCL